MFAIHNLLNGTRALEKLKNLMMICSPLRARDSDNPQEAKEPHKLKNAMLSSLPASDSPAFFIDPFIICFW
jgi:hypothetical protein